MNTPASLRALLLVIVSLVAALSASAQNAPLQSYDVELVIFRHLNPNATPEEWSLEAQAAGERLSIPDEETSAFSSSEPPPQSTQSFPALRQSKLKLTAVEEALRRSRNYRPVAHFGWTQPGYPRNDAKFFSIDSLAPSAAGLQGQVALSRGRYLHLTLDLVYEIPEEPGQRYVLRQTRRMRSSERHYIDHPKFGVIALITPADPGA